MASSRANVTRKQATELDFHFAEIVRHTADANALVAAHCVAVRLCVFFSSIHFVCFVLFIFLIVVSLFRSLSSMFSKQMPKVTLKIFRKISLKDLIPNEKKKEKHTQCTHTRRG